MSTNMHTPVCHIRTCDVTYAPVMSHVGHMVIELNVRTTALSRFWFCRFRFDTAGLCGNRSINLRHTREWTFQGTLSKPSNVNVVFGENVGGKSRRAAKSGRAVKSRANVTERLGFSPIIT